MTNNLFNHLEPDFLEGNKCFMSLKKKLLQMLPEAQQIFKRASGEHLLLIEDRSRFSINKKSDYSGFSSFFSKISLTSQHFVFLNFLLRRPFFSTHLWIFSGVFCFLQYSWQCLTKFSVFSSADGDAETELQGTSPILTVTPKQEILASLGVPKGEILEAISIAMGGEEVGHIYEGVQKFPVLVRLDEKNRSDLNVIRSLPVELGERNLVPLSQAAEVEFDEGYGLINREQTKRRVAVLINPRGVDTETFVRAAQEKVEKEVKLPPGSYLEWGGNFKNLIQARNRLAIFAPRIFLVRGRGIG